MDAMELFTFRRTQNYDPDAGIDESVIGGLSVESFGKARWSMRPLPVCLHHHKTPADAVSRLLNRHPLVMKPSVMPSWAESGHRV